MLGVAIISVFLQDGIIVDRFDEKEQAIWLSIPEDSFAYHDFHTDRIRDAESYIKVKKEKFIEMLKMPNLKLYYRTRKGFWTKEQGQKNYREHINDYL